MISRSIANIRRLKVFRVLPADLRDTLNAKILAGETDDYLPSWLQERGYHFAVSTVYRYTKKVREADGETPEIDRITLELGVIERQIHSLEERKRNLLKPCEEQSGASRFRATFGRGL